MTRLEALQSGRLEDPVPMTSFPFARNAGVAERLSDDLKALTLQALTPAALSERFRTWRDDVSGWRERARVLGATLRLRAWDAMAVQMAGIVEQVG